ncbi:transglycosylase domain-containing protein [Curtobacterium flaccumfaciens]|uniref:Transglycosylase domain-containing protein n=1 Tax=Curtobacterium poinsettiae TaxID=159612 RepID=A0A9Q9T3D9_9MICO|nr:transglycosylase domain-containing protein [Curtobacterium flaccumfaciens]UXN25763.1 transglycosylase domain-containing protein [Curtobacterium flaccumfaciens]UYC80601.1 transglycosylase domain-containing protein [Curtobacterium flaccumfaciens pv. poinsettiae]
MTMRRAGGAALGFVGGSVLAGLLVSVGVTPVIAVAGVGTTSAIGVFESLPEDIEIGQLPQRNQIWAYRGGEPVHLANVWDQDRQELSLEQISDELEHAAVDGEDKRFYETGGVDATSVVRSLVSVATSGTEGGSGGSTLTMQLVRNIKIQQASELPTAEEREAAYEDATRRTPQRKLAEMKLAISLAKQYTKQQILAAYLNIAYFGDQTYGVQSAAQHYYGKSATDLTPAEAASLIAIVQWPERRDLSTPDHHRDNAARRNVILRSMHEQGHLSTGEYRTARLSRVADYVHLTAPQQGCEAVEVGAEFFCDHAETIAQRLPQLGTTKQQRADAWRTGGYRIQTTLDLDLNAQQKRLLDQYDPKTETRLALGATFNTVEAGTGRVLTMAQNTDHDRSSDAPRTATSLNYATDQADGGSTGFQTGSTYKMFTLLAWIEAGRSPDTVVNGTPHPHSEWTACGGPTSAFWQPKNDSPGQRGPYSVRSATAQSVNAAYQSMAEQLDLCDIRDVAEGLGVHLATGGELPWNPASLLGTESIAPLTMASAYAGIANGGRFCAPVVIDQVIAPDGEELGGQPRTCTQAVSPQTAATAFDVMQGAFRGGTASGGQTPDGATLFGKTGTTDAADQVWLVGGTARAVTAYWQGNTDGAKHNLRSFSNGQGGTYAGSRAAVWRDAQTAVNAALPVG